jgi:hypothetical protein
MTYDSIDRALTTMPSVSRSRAGTARRVVPRHVLTAVLLLSPLPALAQDSDAPQFAPPSDGPPSDAQPPSATPPPSEAPPAPPSEIPQPPPPTQIYEPPNEPGMQQGQEQPPSEAMNQPALPEGQWVFTNQYGWVWMPYAQTYTFVPNDGYPAMYLYGPRLGWRWVVAPWVFGWGPQPYWGLRGRGHFGWYAHPWFAHREFRGGGGYAGGARWHGGGRVAAPRYGGHAGGHRR